MTELEIAKERQQRRQEHELSVRLSFNTKVDYSLLNSFIYSIRKAMTKRKKLNLSLHEVYKRIKDRLHGSISFDLLQDLEMCGANESYKELVKDVESEELLKKLLLISYQYFVACQYPPDGNNWKPVVTGPSL